MSPYEFVQRAQKLISGGQHQEAVKVCRLGLLAQPKDVEGRLTLGAALMALGRYDEVLAEMRVALEVEPDNARALTLKGEGLLRKGDRAAAIGILERAQSLGASTQVRLLLDEAHSEARASSPFSAPKTPDPGGRPRPPLTVDYVDRDDPTKHYPFRRENADPAQLAKVPSFPVVGRPDPDPDDGLRFSYDKRQARPPTMDEATVVAQTPGIAPDDSGVLIDVRSADVLHETAANLHSAGAVLHETEEVLGDTREVSPGPHETAARPTLPERPARRQNADLDAMFPEDDAGVSRLEHAMPGEIMAASEARKPAERPVPPSPAPPQSPSPAPQQDMRTIRAGLGLPADDSGGFRAQLRAELGAKKPRPAESDSGARKKTVGPRRGLLWAGYAAIAVVILGGAVFAGLQIRGARLESRVAEASAQAASMARADTYSSYVAAVAARERILKVAATDANRAALARARAELAFVFGANVNEAKKLAASVSESEAADAAVAGALIALLDADGDGARDRATKIGAAGGAGVADFITGYADLIDGDAGAARSAFERATAAEDRPRNHLGLARALAASGDYKAALAEIEKVLGGDADSPAATIFKARILAATDEAAASALVPKLTELSASDALSPAHRSWARLAMAEIAMATGKPKIARSAMAPLADAELSDFALAESAAEMFLALGDASTAATLAARVVARWPARKPARILIARAHLAAGNARSALTAFSEAGDLSDLPAALADRGRAYLATGDIDKAAADLDAALAADPSLTPAQIARAKVDLARDDAAAAIARLHPLIEAKAGPEVVVAYAAALARTGKTKQARALLDKLVAAGGDWHAHLQLARLARESGDFSEASEHYRAAMTNTAPVTVRIEAATALFEAGDAKAARKLIEPATSGDGASAKALILAAELAGMAGDSGDAKKLLDRAEKRPSPPTWLIDRERGRLALAANHAKDAVSHLRACVDAHGDSAEAWLLLLSAQLKLEDGAAAKKTVAQIRKQFPESATAALARGREAYYENQSGDALAAFSKAQRRLEKTNASPRRQAVAAYWIGSVHYYTGDLERAKDALDRAVKLDPSLTAAYLTLGNVEYGLERFAEAAKAYERVTELAPRANPDAWFYLGDMATRIGDTKLAKKALETYRKRAPKGDFAKEAARLLKTLP